MLSAVVASIFLTAFHLASLPRCVNVGGKEVCPYFAVYRMNDAVHREGFGTLLVSKALDSTCVLLLNDVFYYSFGFVCYFTPRYTLALLTQVQNHLFVSCRWMMWVFGCLFFLCLLFYPQICIGFIDTSLQSEKVRFNPLTLCQECIDAVNISFSVRTELAVGF